VGADREWAQEGALGERAAPPGDRWRRGKGKKICHGAATAGGRHVFQREEGAEMWI
jgi:hypothetical protein